MKQPARQSRFHPPKVHLLGITVAGGTGTAFADVPCAANSQHRQQEKQRRGHASFGVRYGHRAQHGRYRFHLPRSGFSSPNDVPCPAMRNAARWWDCFTLPTLQPAVLKSQQAAALQNAKPRGRVPGVSTRRRGKASLVLRERGDAELAFLAEDLQGSSTIQTAVRSGGGLQLSRRRNEPGPRGPRRLARPRGRVLPPHRSSISCSSCSALSD